VFNSIFFQAVVLNNETDARSSDLWIHQQFINIGWGTNNALGDADAEVYSDRIYAVGSSPRAGGAEAEGIGMVSNKNPWARKWSDNGELANASETKYTYMNDPSLIHHGGTWYLYASASNQTADSEMVNILVWTASKPTGEYDYHGSTGINVSSTWATEGVSEPDVAYDESKSRFVMSITGKRGGQQIGFATSDTGIQYTPVANNPQTHSYSEDQELLISDGEYLIYQNPNPQEMVKMSSDNLSQNFSSEGVALKRNKLLCNTNGVYAPTIIKYDGVYHMWYTAFGHGDSYCRAHAIGTID
jgi:hypothetical protein